MPRWITTPDYSPGVPRPLAPAPTATRPGSPERIAVYCRRAARGCRLHHPRDVKLPRLTDGRRGVFALALALPVEVEDADLPIDDGWQRLA